MDSAAPRGERSFVSGKNHSLNRVKGIADLLGSGPLYAIRRLRHPDVRPLAVELRPADIPRSAAVVENRAEIGKLACCGRPGDDDGWRNAGVEADRVATLIVIVPEEPGHDDAVRIGLCGAGAIEEHRNA